MIARALRRPASALNIAASAPRQRGLVLITGLLFLVVLTMLGLSLFRSSGVMDRISANTRDKQRSFEAAQSSLSYGEFWLANGGGGTNTANCTGLVSGDVLANIHTCPNALPANPVSPVPFTNAFTYTPPNLALSTRTDGNGGGLTASGDAAYSTLPGFYVEYLGLSKDGKKTLYQVTAYGTGGSTDTVSVVRSTYALTPAVHAL